MRRSDKQITDSQLLTEILQQGRELSLAMNDGEHPYVLPLNYGYADGCIYIHCARQGKKLDCLRANPKVGFVISTILRRVAGDAACQWSTRFRSIIGQGAAAIVEDRESIIAGYDVIMRHFGGPVGGYEEKHLNNSLIIRIEIDSMVGKQSP